MPAPEGKGMWIRHRDGLFSNGGISVDVGDSLRAASRSN
jgi:hypothetical protein